MRINSFVTGFFANKLVRFTFSSLTTIFIMQSFYCFKTSKPSVIISHISIIRSAGLSHSTMAHHMLPPPKLHRSISTPAGHSSPLNAVNLLPSLDDNPFFKASYSAALNGHMLVSLLFFLLRY